MIKFYEGAISLEYAESMPFQKIFFFQNEAVKINREIEKKVNA